MNGRGDWLRANAVLRCHCLASARCLSPAREEQAPRCLLSALRWETGARGALTCDGAPSDWSCTLDDSDPAAPVAILKPDAPGVDIAAGEMACFDLHLHRPSTAPGLALLRVEQAVSARTIEPLLQGASSSACPTVTWAYSRPDDRTARLQEAASWTAWLSDAGDHLATSWTGTIPEAPR